MSSEDSEDVPRVLVTGASGYIATHIVQQLLQTGLYRVRGVLKHPCHSFTTKVLLFQGMEGSFQT